MMWLRRIAQAGLVAVALAASIAHAGDAAPTKAESAAPARALFVITYRPCTAWKAGVPMAEQGLKAHGAYMQSLLDGGRLFAGGGFVTSEGGMAIVYAETRTEAEALLAADPAIVSGIFVATIEHWRPRFHSEAALVRKADD